MMKVILMKMRVFKLLVLSLMVYALGVQLAVADEFADSYFSNQNLPLDSNEKAALGLADKWIDGSDTGAKPFAGANGRITFVYGVQQPSVVCAVLKVCTIMLERGEASNSLDLGDKIRWEMSPGVVGSGGDETEVFNLKPLDSGIETNFVITTNKRIYHIRLKAHRSSHMPVVDFVYSNPTGMTWADAKELVSGEGSDSSSKVVERDQRRLDVDATDLDFAYDVKGSARWKPVRIYNDSQRTIIEMPPDIGQMEAPSLLVIRKSKGWFTADEEVMVNYRVQGHRYIVDSVFDKAVLLAGVDGAQERVSIARSSQ